MSRGKNDFTARLAEAKELWTLKVTAFTEQQTLDAVCLALAEGFGFGPERLNRFRNAFDVKYAEIRALEHADTRDGEYAIAKQEQALQRACGQYYVERKKRYDFRLLTPGGKTIKL